MPETPQQQVVVLGSGPAGLATAISLKNLNPDLAVQVVGGPASRPSRPGETLPPLVEPLLQRLGVWSAFLRDAPLASHSSASAWGTSDLRHNEFIFHPFNRGWHVERSRFDALLAQHASALDVQFLRNADCSDHQHSDKSGWILTLIQPGVEPQPVRADFVVDATGRRGQFSKRLGSRRKVVDRLVGAIVTFRQSTCAMPTAGQNLVEAWENGWWYSTAIPGSRVVVACMADDDAIRAFGLRSFDRWQFQLNRTTHTAARLKHASPEGTPVIHPAHSYQLASPTGAGWLAVGDALGTVDPLSSLGVFMALRSGILASYAIHDVLRGQTGGLQKYEMLAARDYAGYLTARTGFYREETRWPHAPFWRRRQGLADLVPAGVTHGLN